MARQRPELVVFHLSRKPAVAIQDPTTPILWHSEMGTSQACEQCELRFEPDLAEVQERTVCSGCAQLLEDYQSSSNEHMNLVKNRIPQRMENYDSPHQSCLTLVYCRKRGRNQAPKSSTYSPIQSQFHKNSRKSYRNQIEFNALKPQRHVLLELLMELLLLPPLPLITPL